MYMYPLQICHTLVLSVLYMHVLLCFLCRYRVYGSLHRALSAGQEVRLLVDKSSVEGVDGFYAQVLDMNQQGIIEAFANMSEECGAYGEANKAQSASYV